MSISGSIGMWGVSFGLVNIFVFCFIADRTTSSLATVGDMAYQSMWYKYRVRQQKYIILIIRRAEKPVNFYGLKMVDCNLKRFSTVSNLVYKVWFTNFLNLQFFLDNAIDLDLLFDVAEFETRLKKQVKLIGLFENNRLIAFK